MDSLELVVLFIADDMEEENDNEDGRCAGWSVGELFVGDCESCSSDPGSAS